MALFFFPVIFICPSSFPFQCICNFVTVLKQNERGRKKHSKVKRKKRKTRTKKEKITSLYRITNWKKKDLVLENSGLVHVWKKKRDLVLSPE